MCDSERKQPELAGWQLLTKLRRILDFFVILLPVIVPFLLGVPAYVLFNLSLNSTGSIKALHANYPSAYIVVPPNSEQWSAKGAVIVPVKGDSSAFSVVINRLVEYRARFIWLTACVTFWIVSLAACGISTWIIWCSLRDWRVIGVASLLVCYLFLRVCAGVRFIEELGKGFPDKLLPLDLDAFSVLGLHLIFDPLKCLDHEFQKLAWVMHSGSLVLLGIVTTFLVTAAATTLAAPPNGEKRSSTFLAEQNQRGQVFLYTACTAMIVTIIYVAACSRWPVELLPKGERLREYLAAYTTVSVAAQGVLSSILLLGSYIPMTLVQNAQARKFALENLVEKHQEGKIQEGTAGIGSKEVQEFLAEHHLLTPLSSQFQRVGAMLLPAMASHLFTLFAAL